MLVANLQACQEFLRKYQPAFSGTFTLNEFRHVNPLKRVSISRTVTARSMITNGSVSLIDLHIKLGGESDAHAGVLGIEEALPVPSVPVLPGRRLALPPEHVQCPQCLAKEVEPPLFRRVLLRGSAVSYFFKIFKFTL